LLSGVILLWFILTGLSVAFVAIDIRSTPESPVMKWAFVLVVLYTGPIGAFFYVLGCREPLPGMHAPYVEARWRQALGSTMHCVAGDGIGILAGAVIGSMLHLSMPAHIALEYVLGFGFGWTIFQSLFMREEADGSFSRALSMTFIPEFLSMNALMSGMVPAMTFAMVHVLRSEDPLGANFWFVMSISLLTGAIIAYPMNWWLVAHHLKHGMKTVTRLETAKPIRSDAMPEMEQKTMDNMRFAKPSTAAIVKVAIVSIAMFGVGIFPLVIILNRH